MRPSDVWATAGIRISKLHLSSALKAKPTPANLERLGHFKEDVYLHQVVVAKEGEIIRRHKDLDPRPRLRGNPSGGTW